MRVLWLAILISTVAHAGNETGNGGDVVYCPNPTTGQKRVELLDYFEAKTFLPDWSLPFEYNSFDVALKTFFGSFEWIDPYRAELFASWSQVFFDEVEWAESELEDVPDSHHIVLPIGCSIRQIAIQRFPYQAGKRYTIHRPLWDQLSASDQVGLMLHEFFYRDALEHGHRNSIQARKAHALAVGREDLTLGYLDPPKWAYLLDKMGLSFRVRYFSGNHFIEIPILRPKFSWKPSLVGFEFERIVSDGQEIPVTGVAATIWTVGSEEVSSLRMSRPIDLWLEGRLIPAVTRIQVSELLSRHSWIESLSVGGR